jgi:hypothetical protein
LGISGLGKTSRTSGGNIGLGVVMLLIDEIDFVVSVSSSGGVTGAKQTEPEKYLSWLHCLALNENFQLGWIYTFNSIYNDMASHLNALEMVSGWVLSLLVNPGTGLNPLTGLKLRTR